MNSKYLYILLLAIASFVSCKNDSRETKPVSGQIELIDFEVVEKDEFTQRNDINYSKFDSLTAQWSGDTLFLSHVFMKTGSCGEFEFVNHSYKGSIDFAFQGIGECTLATFFQINARLYIPVDESVAIFYNGCLLRKNTSANISYK